MKLTKRTVALSYLFVFVVGMIFANSLRTGQPEKGLLWLSILLVILSPQLKPTSARLQKTLIVVQSLLCVAAIALVVVLLRS